MFIIIKIGIFFLNIVYFFMKVFPTKKQILIISRQSNSKSLDIELLEDSLKKELSDYKILVLTKQIENKFLYAFYLLKLMYHIARSKLVILDSYCIPISLLHHKKELKVIQMWHAIGLMKKAGYASLNTEEGRSLKVAQTLKMHYNYNYAFASSKACVDAMSEVFHIDKEKIVIKLLPRVDLLKNKKYQEETKKRIYDSYEILKKKKNILYIPTFRKEETEMSLKVKELIDSIDYEKYNLIVKFHPNSNIVIDNPNVLTCSSFSSMEMLFVADYIISDYSSIIYEAVILKKPMYFYAFDLEQYEVKRGLFIDYQEEMPGIITSSGEELFQEIEKNNYDFKKQEQFSKKYLDLSKDSNTLDIVNLVKSNL